MRVQLNAAEDSVYTAFFRLSRLRNVSIGAFGGSIVGGIPLTEVEAWLNLDGVFDIDTRSEFKMLILALDQAWLKDADAKHKDNRPKARC